MAKRELDSNAFNVKKVGVLKKVGDSSGQAQLDAPGSAPEVAEPSATTPPTLSRKKPGRKREHGEDGPKMDQPVTVNFTPEEKAKLETKSAELLGAPITKIIRQALIEKGLI